MKISTIPLAALLVASANVKSISDKAINSPNGTTEQTRFETNDILENEALGPIHAPEDLMPTIDIKSDFKEDMINGTWCERTE